MRAAALLLLASLGAAPAPAAALPAGRRTVVDAHNCYPYNRQWSDRIDRALSVGAPLAIEQDLAWYTDPRTGQSRSVLSHSAAGAADAPGMRAYFFERVRPQIEAALRQGNRGDWPLITLNLDLKSQQPAHLAAIWALLDQYRDWLTTAPRVAELQTPQPLDVKPILVLTGSSAAQQRVFYDQVPVGGRLLVFGAVSSPSAVADNYHRWSNNRWSRVETGGPAWATPWTAAKQARLQRLVDDARRRGLWIRFFSLDGAGWSERRREGWSFGYDFGSLAAAQQRWLAAQRAGVDYLATDQYETLAATLRHPPPPRAPAVPPRASAANARPSLWQRARRLIT